MSLMSTVTRHSAARTTISGSVAIRADRLHYTGDVLMNGSVILSLALAQWLGVQWIDPICGIAIAGYMLFGAVQIARTSLDMLMDRELSDEVRLQIEATAKRHPEVLAVHDLRTRSSGPRLFIQFHMVLPAEISLSRAHIISDEVEAALLEAFPGAEILIHQDPTDAVEPEMAS